jgi:hypothetical protein
MGQIQFDHSPGQTHGLQSRPPSYGSGATAAQLAQPYAERTALLNLELTDPAKTRCAPFLLFLSIFCFHLNLLKIELSLAVEMNIVRR